MMDDNKSINRRDFLGLAGKIGAGAVIASLPIINGCKGGPTEPEPPEPKPQPVPVDLEFKIYNHTQGLEASFSKNQVMSETTFALIISDLINEYAISGVDLSRIALREDNFGKLVQYSNEGSVNLTVPRQDTIYNVFLFNSGPNDLYHWMDDLPVTGWDMDFMFNTINMYRQDLNGYTGEERVWGGEPVPEIGGYPGVFDQINQALSPEKLPFIYGYYERASRERESYGFGECQGFLFWGLGNHVQVNSNLVKAIPEQIGLGLGAVFQRTIGWYGRYWGDYISDAPAKIQTNGVLHDAGKDAFAYMFVRGARVRSV